MSTECRFEVRSFDSLSARELYEVLALRQRVFVVEQRCAYLDADGRDAIATHVLGREDDRLVAYARILPEGARLPERSIKERSEVTVGRLPPFAGVGMPSRSGATHVIGRVIVAPEARGRGLSRALMEHAMAAILDAHGPVPIALAAQAHLEGLYASLGFERTGSAYDEDGIPHVDMRRPPAS